MAAFTTVIEVVCYKLEKWKFMCLSIGLCFARGHSWLRFALELPGLVGRSRAPAWRTRLVLFRSVSLEETVWCFLVVLSSVEVCYRRQMRDRKSVGTSVSCNTQILIFFWFLSLFSFFFFLFFFFSFSLFSFSRWRPQIWKIYREW